MDKPDTEDPNLKAVAENMSELTPEVIEKQKKDLKAENTAPAASPAPASKGIRGKTDRQGRTFDPSLHEVDSEGNPKINRDGFLAGKPGRPVRNEKNRQEGQGFSPENKQSAAEPSPQSIAQNQNLSRITTALFIRIGVGVFGEEWLPQRYEIKDMGVTIDEQAELQNAFDQYFRAKNMKDLTPGWALVLALSGYAAARVTKPTTQSRFKIIAGRVGNLTGKFFSKVTGFMKKIFKGAKVASYVDHGNNGVGKDDSSPKVS